MAPLKSRNLTFPEREEIALECARGTGIRAIARKLGRSPSSISREIRRNSATPGRPRLSRQHCAAAC
ncbi:helix-turn-helix domain-containing protein [Oceaniovalibus sp. ACAM 378]|uniref:helix-turn-helix domain-containing protein n=1 Tax=Oceaniovalibus sp. ACAM 378 TaxID=2599923 RepID=UPI0011D637CC|nr:helix-turn-helix domain-containing protein [Oceaniovalibus sp. ACAM 378]